MKDLLLICASLIFAYSAAHADCDPSTLRAGAFAEVENLYCTTDKLAQAIARQEQTVPKVIYHFTKQQHADENARLGTISPEVWKNKIMGTDSRFKLSPLRKGLYGTSSVEANSFGTASYPALMEIRIKDECRRPERTASLASLADDPRFQGYLTAHPEYLMTLLRFKTECSLQEEDFTLDSIPAACRDTIAAFLKDQRISVLQDHFISQSYYIRDRECIEGIRGTVEDQIRILNEQELNWVPRCENNFQSSHNLALLIVHLTRQSIAKDQLPGFDRKRILVNAKKVSEPAANGVGEFLDQIEECKKTKNLSAFKNILDETLRKIPYLMLWELDDIRCP